MLEKGYNVKASTTSEIRLKCLKQNGIEPFLIEIESLKDNVQTFLKADILIINIPSKNPHWFQILIHELLQSEISNILFISSTSVYGNSSKIITESDGKELDDNPLFKIETMFSNNKKFKSTILRFGGLIGYSRQPGNFFASGKPIKNPESRVNLIHRDDCIEIISRIIEKEIWGEVFNCCADTHPTKRAFYSYAAEAAGNDLPDFANGDDKSYKIISNEKVKKFLNYKFKHPDLMKIKF